MLDSAWAAQVCFASRRAWLHMVFVVTLLSRVGRHVFGPRLLRGIRCAGSASAQGFCLWWRWAVERAGMWFHAMEGQVSSRRPWKGKECEILTKGELICTNHTARDGTLVHGEERQCVHLGLCLGRGEYVCIHGFVQLGLLPSLLWQCPPNWILAVLCNGSLSLSQGWETQTRGFWQQRPDCD